MLLIVAFIKIPISEADAAVHPEWMCNSGSMSWDIQVDKKVAFNVGYGAGNKLELLDEIQACHVGCEWGEY